MRVASVMAIFVAFVLGPSCGADADERVLRAELIVQAPVNDVWRAWTTNEGVRSFFAPGSHVEPRVDGAYEIFFNPSAPPGWRGTDGMRVLVFEPQKRFAFSWNAPAALGAVREQRTVVTLEFAAVDATRSRLRFSHSGWGSGPEWDAAYAYFEKAWAEFVLPSLVYRFTHGPVNWDRVPVLQPVTKSMRRRLSERP